MKLNHKQEKFVEFYAGNERTKAAMAAGVLKKIGARSGEQVA